MNDVEQMVVVHRVNLDEHIEIACRIMTFNNFRNFFQTFHNRIKFFRILKIKTYIGTCLIAYLFRIDNKLRPLKNTQVYQFLNTLMDGRTTNITCSRHFQKRNTRIFGYKPQNMLV